MELGLDGKIALVTGGSRGIGAAASRALAAHGATVIVNYMQNREKAEEVLAEIEQNGGSGKTVQADVRVSQAVDTMVHSTLREFGRIDIFVNNANIGFPIKPFTQLTWDEIQSKLVGEMKALYNCSHAVLRDMVERGSGKLIFVSSGLSRRPGYGFAAHAAAKAAVDSIARVMAMELGPCGITVNVVGPGLTETDAVSDQPVEMKQQVAEMTPLKRIGLPDDISGTIVYLASSLSDFVTGQYIHVSGGLAMP